MTKTQIAIVSIIIGTLLLILTIGGGIYLYSSNGSANDIQESYIQNNTLPSDSNFQNGGVLDCDSEEECQQLIEQQFPGGSGSIIECGSEEECAEFFGGEMPEDGLMFECETKEECDQKLKDFNK